MLKRAHDMTPSLQHLQRYGLQVRTVKRTFPGSYTVYDGLQPLAHPQVVDMVRTQAVQAVARDLFTLSGSATALRIAEL